MEFNQTSKHSAGDSRVTGFLLGIIVSLAICYTALQYTTSPSSAEDDNFSDDIAQDMLAMQPMDQRDMIAAMLPPPPGSKSITENIKEVKKTAALDEINKLNVDNDDKTDGASINAAVPVTDIENTDSEHDTNALSPVETDPDDAAKNLRIIESLPDFPGGMVEFMKWLTKNLKYPALAKSQKIQGKVVVQFIVNRDGTLSDKRIAVSVDPLLDREAMRVIAMMPRWKPGTQNGKPCRTLFSIPIVFSL